MIITSQLLKKRSIVNIERNAISYKGSVDLFQINNMVFWAPAQSTHDYIRYARMVTFWYIMLACAWNYANRKQYIQTIAMLFVMVVMILLRLSNPRRSLWFVFQYPINPSQDSKKANGDGVEAQEIFIITEILVLSFIATFSTLFDSFRSVQVFVALFVCGRDHQNG